MRAAIAVLCFIVVAFINPIESMFGLFKKKNQRYQRIPKINTPLTYTKLSANVYFTKSGMDEVIRSADRGPVRVGIMVEGGFTYVIGYIGQKGESDKGPLRPFVKNGPQFKYGWGRIKIRVDDNYAYKFAPIPVKDTAINELFYKPYTENLIRTFEIEVGSRAKPLEPITSVRATNPTVRGHASSSQASTSRVRVGLHQRPPQCPKANMGPGASTRPPILNAPPWANSETFRQSRRNRCTVPK